MIIRKLIGIIASILHRMNLLLDQSKLLVKTDKWVCDKMFRESSQFELVVPRVLLGSILLFPALLEILFIGILKVFRIVFNPQTTVHPRIAKAPGAKLLTIVDFLFSPKTVEQTFKPIVADWRREFFEALKQGRTWKAQWISMRYRCAFGL